jgi:SAM-dependent methyltransferase
VRYLRPRGLLIMAEISLDVKEQLARINETFGCLVDARPEIDYPGTSSLFDRLALSDVKNIEDALPALFGTAAAKMLAHWKVSNLPHYRREILRYGSAIAPEVVESKVGLINAVPPSDIHSMIRQDVFVGDLYSLDMALSAILRANLDFRPGERYLEFGCSSAPLLRTISAVLPDCEWHGCDPVAASIAWATPLFPRLKLLKSEQAPPLTYPNEFFSGAQAISVWSHFSETAALAWFGEMWRIIRPGGFLMFTTHGPRSLYYYLECGLRDSGTMSRLISDILDKSYAFYPIFELLGVSDSDLLLKDWGECYFVYDWVKSFLSDKWTIRRYDPGLNQFNQDVYVIVRR